MEYFQNGGFWKLAVLLVAAICHFGAGFFSKKFAEGEDKQMMVKMVLKIIAFVLAIFAAVAVMFL